MGSMIRAQPMGRDSAQPASPTNRSHNSSVRVRKGLQEVVADEIPDEARGLEKDVSGNEGMERPIGIEPTPEPWQICRGRIFKDLRDILGSLK